MFLFIPRNHTHCTAGVGLVLVQTLTYIDKGLTFLYHRKDQNSTFSQEKWIFKSSNTTPWNVDTTRSPRLCVCLTGNFVVLLPTSAGT